MYTRADDYNAFIHEMNLAVGYRVPGIPPALANGGPGAIVNQDTRSAELANTHAIPLVGEKDEGPKQAGYSQLAQLRALQRAILRGV